MITFTVSKPQSVPLEKGRINLKQIREIWDNNGGLAAAVGCYIFAAPNPRERECLMPLYVGRAAKSFRQECFALHKRYKLERFLSEHPSVTELWLYFIVHPARDHYGENSLTAIEELEEYLIPVAYRANPNYLLNKLLAHDDTWHVHGLTNVGKGKRSPHAAQLKTMLGLDDEEETSVVPAVSEPVTVAAACQLPVVESAAQPSANAAAP